MIYHVHSYNRIFYFFRSLIKKSMVAICLAYIYEHTHSKDIIVPDYLQVHTAGKPA